jgi:hypothetical protein
MNKRFCKIDKNEPILSECFVWGTRIRDGKISHFIHSDSKSKKARIWRLRNRIYLRTHKIY